MTTQQRQLIEVIKNKVSSTTGQRVSTDAIAIILSEVNRQAAQQDQGEPDQHFFVSELAAAIPEQLRPKIESWRNLLAAVMGMGQPTQQADGEAIDALRSVKARVTECRAEFAPTAKKAAGHFFEAVRLEIESRTAMFNTHPQPAQQVPERALLQEIVAMWDGPKYKHEMAPLIDRARALLANNPEGKA